MEEERVEEEERKMFRVYFCLCLRYIFVFIFSLESTDSSRQWNDFSDSPLHATMTSNGSVFFPEENIYCKFEFCGLTKFLATKQITHAELTTEIQFHCTTTVSSCLHSSMEQQAENWFPLFTKLFINRDEISQNFAKNSIEFWVGWVLSQFKQNSWISSFEQILAQVLLKLNDKTMCC